MLVGKGKSIFRGGPGGPPGATLASALQDVVAAIKAVLTAPDLPSARVALGLGNVANLAPADYPVSTAQAAAIAAAIAGLVNSSPAALDTLKELADALGDDPNFAATVAGQLGLKAPAARIIAAGTGLAGGGDLSADRTLALAAIATGMVLANTSGGASAPVPTTLSALLDAAIGATRGTLAVRGASGWGALALGPSGHTLQSNGADLVFAAASPGAGAVRNDTPQNPNATQIAQALANVGALVSPQGRLTLTSGVPVLTSAVAAAGTIYYTPAGGQLALVGTGLTTAPVPVVFAEVFQALADATKSPAAAAAGQVYDLFAWLDGTTFRVTRGPAWSAGTSGSNTARGTGAGSTALARVNGLLTNSVAITNGPAAGYGVYVGTIMTDAGGATVTFNPGSSAAGGGAGWIGVWNAFNRARVVANVRDSAASWTYASSAWRSADNSAANRATFVLGLAEEPITATYAVRVSTAGANGVAQTSIGLDSVGAPSALATMTLVQAGGGYVQLSPVATFAGSPGLGAHFLQALELGDGSTTSTFSGNGYQSLVVDGRF